MWSILRLHILYASFKVLKRLLNYVLLSAKLNAKGAFSILSCSIHFLHPVSAMTIFRCWPSQVTGSLKRTYTAHYPSFQPNLGGKTLNIAIYMIMQMRPYTTEDLKNIFRLWAGVEPTSRRSTSRTTYHNTMPQLFNSHGTAFGKCHWSPDFIVMGSRDCCWCHLVLQQS